jgi:hypothetical protein
VILVFGAGRWLVCGFSALDEVTGVYFMTWS